MVWEACDIQGSLHPRAILAGNAEFSCTKLHGGCPIPVRRPGVGAELRFP
jgi:hypothetical protein